MYNSTEVEKLTAKVSVRAARLDNVLVHIYEYKKFRKDRDFEIILGLVDKLILYLIHSIRAKYRHLRLTPIADLYQTSIIALHKSILNIPDNFTSKYFPARLLAYMKSEFRQSYSYYAFKTEIPVSSIADGLFDSPNEALDASTIEQSIKILKDFFTRLDYDYLIDNSFLTKDDDFILRERYVKCRGIREIAKDMNLTYSAASKRLFVLRAKLKEFLTADDNLENFRDGMVALTDEEYESLSLQELLAEEYTISNPYNTDDDSLDEEDGGEIDTVGIEGDS